MKRIRFILLAPMALIEMALLLICGIVGVINPRIGDVMVKNAIDMLPGFDWYLDR